MSQSFTHLAEIRASVARLLDELQLEDYLFNIEPKEGLWELTVECAVKEGWETIKFKANKEYFQHGADDALLHQLLSDELREVLSECKVKTTSKK